MSWVAGLCSVTYRQLAPEAIVALAGEAGLSAIEWGTDIHAPAGDVTRARELAALCTDAGLTCPTLGSYARATQNERSQDFHAVLDTASNIGARTIRVWAGETGFAETGTAERETIAATISGYAEKAHERGLCIALEYHPDTLTDCREGAVWLLDQAAHPALFSYWQPVPDQSVESCRGDLAAMGARLAHLHVFFWKGERVRHPLSQGADYWTEILTGQPIPEGGHAFLEFVPGDDPGLLKREAAALADLLDRAARPQATEH